MDETRKVTGQVTVKLISSCVHKEYRGVPVNRGSAVGAMKSLFNGGRAQGSSKKSTTSTTLYTVNILDEHLPGDADINVAALLDRAYGLEDANARAKLNAFYAAVESGKNQLADKYGDQVPVTEIEALADRLSDKKVDLFKHQIITTKTSRKYFSGATKVDDVYTKSVKSKVFYTLEELTVEQVEQLKESMKDTADTGSIVARYNRVRNREVTATVVRDARGNVTFVLPEFHGTQSVRVGGKSGKSG